MIKEIKAYKTKDGKIFQKKEVALAYAKDIQPNIDRNKILKKKSKEIRKRVLKEYKDYLRNFKETEPLTLKDISKPWQKGDWGWDCDHKDNPIDKCVYISVDHENGYSGGSCVFCGDPEEQK